MDVGARFRFKVPSGLFLSKFIQAMLAHSRQPDPLYRTAPGIECISLILSLPPEPPLVDRNSSS